MTPTQLFDSVRYYTNRPNESTTVLERWADMATGRLNTTLRDHPRMYRQGQYTAGVGQTQIPLPYDCLRIRGLRRGTTNLPQFTQANVIVDCDDGFIERGDCLELTVAPTEETVYTINYHQALTPPTVNGGVNWVLQFFPDTYLYTTLSEAAVSLKDRENGPVWEQLAKERLAFLVAQGWDQNLADAPRCR